VSKTPVKKATPKKPAAGKAAAARTPTAKAAKPGAKAAPKAAPKAPAKVVAKPVAKPIAKPTSKPSVKPSAKSSPKPPLNTAPKSTAKPAARPVAKPAAKPSAKPAAKPVEKPAVKPAARSETAAVPAAKPAAPAPAAKPSRAAVARALAAPLPAPLPPATSRFADRFAPPRPPTRQMNNLGLDTPKPTQKADPKLANAWKTKSGRDLTEAEILAMPDSEYMNEKQLEFFRVKLQTLKDDLLSNAGETTEHLREDTSIVPDPADRATIEEEHALELRTRDRERKLLKKISQSLNRIDAGDYGFCDETGEPIGLGRLIARPTATLSLEAQQRRELKQKMFGD
jgi:DnaK suppressor protein